MSRQRKKEGGWREDLAVKESRVILLTEKRISEKRGVHRGKYRASHDPERPSRMGRKKARSFPGAEKRDVSSDKKVEDEGGIFNYSTGGSSRANEKENVRGEGKRPL